jgi:hypothetical protein
MAEQSVSAIKPPCDLSGRWSRGGLIAKEAGRTRMLRLVVECHDTGAASLLSCCLHEVLLLLQLLFLLLLGARCVPLSLSFRIALFAALGGLCLSLFSASGLSFVIRRRPGLNFLFSCPLVAVVFGWY